ncbi:26S proteasome non-ATPase regulatory subunit 9 isoform X2 [Biomphalaria pfeifferi]|uniref:26S proteasome non-ATPase regulatory subunit 9 isoform X2 n=1 Tax=Biomphalaria pfeifferi TaxID=112525 RepID=A0AAD8F8D3_BIOPF|nr:26S proteasome non-ATPase regulatory subunit 9 isoform X2 [Biomphalaria pfeifferi]
MAATRRYEELSRKKNEIESNIKEFMDLLQSQKGVGLNEPLVDSEGYPRSDIDVYSCRHARHQISCLQNDHLIVMKEIEEELVRIHQAARELKSMESEMNSANIMRDGMEVDRIPFALVDRVDSGSPAAEGGLIVGDQLIEFGSVTSDNFVNLQTIATVLQHSKNKPLRAVVLRGNRAVHLNVTPSAWSGHGLLGCNIKPFK